MEEKIFYLKENSEFIELMRLLKACDLCSTGGEAKMVISEGEVLFNGETELQKRKKIRNGDVVEFNGAKIVVKDALL